MLSDFVGTERFELLRTIGQGGFGTVYEAIDRTLAARVALKVLRNEDSGALLKFKDEFRLFSRLSLGHENLVNLYDLFEDNRRWFFTMELVRGMPLVAYTRSLDALRHGVDRDSSKGRLNEKRLRSSFAQLARALSSIHSFNIVHCDIKPSNVLVTPDDRVVVLDFGLASERSSDSSWDETATPPSRIFGTPLYMAPEQRSSRGVTTATDWYSFGVVLYQALTGHLPFDGSPLDVLDAKDLGLPPHPMDLADGVPHELAELAMRLLDPEPEGRPDEFEVLDCLRDSSQSRKVSRPQQPRQQPFVGRAPELQALRDALEASRREPVVVTISGQSGIGKSALLHRFLEQERGNEPDLLTFEGRCYERESMPFKAIDPLLDAIAQHWKSLSDRDAARLLPRDVAILARMFPVLGQVHEVQHAPMHGTGMVDSFTLRRRAAEALRDLLYRLGAPLLLTIDDAQWGDPDSASILQQVLRPPDGPPLLLILASRSEGADSGDFLGKLLTPKTDSVIPRIVALELGPLTANETLDLTRVLTGGTAVDSHVHAIAHESRGNAFMIQELALNAPSAGPTTIEAVVWNRLKTLPDTALRFVTATAMSAQPIPSGVARRAAEFGPDDGEPFQMLRAARLVRTHGGSQEPAYEPYHDRIRESITSRLSPAEMQDWHRRLAAAWETSPHARPETLVSHFQHAGDTEKTHRYAQVAAQHAEEALAFERAASFYQLLIGHETDRSLRLIWHAKLGEAYSNAGKGRDAARSFLDALDEPTSDRSIDLERRAAAELIRAGYLDDATVVLKRLLPKVGVGLPANNISALTRLFAFRLLLAGNGPSFRSRPEWVTNADILRRIDVLFSVSEPLCFTSLLRGQALFSQGAWHALRAGEPSRVFRALTGLAASLSASGTRARGKADSLLAVAREMPAAVTDPWSRARVLLTEGIVLKQTGHLKPAIERLERALALFAECRGVHWEVTTAETIIHDSLLWTGQWSTMANELPARLQAAEQRGDIYLAAYAGSRTRPVLLMAADRCGAAREAVARSLARWTSADLQLQRRSALCTRLDLDLYEANGDHAERELTAAWPGLRGILLSYQFGRMEMTFYRARISLARARRHPEALQRAEGDARRLAAEKAPLADALALLILAAVDRSRRGTAAGIDALLAAEAALRACDLNHYAAAAEYRRGILVGGREGAAMVGSASEWMRNQQMINPESMSNLLAPGPW